MSNGFVFIIEGQQGGYSKNTISSINAQVARFGHQKRRLLAKSKSATASPPTSALVVSSTTASPISISNDTSTCPSCHKRRPQNVQFDTRIRRASAPASIRAELVTKPEQAYCDHCLSNGRYSDENIHPWTVHLPRCPIDNTSHHNYKQDQIGDESESETEDDLFSQLCGLTNSPFYHPFPCSLTSEEQRLMQFWFTALGSTFGMTFEPETFQGPLIKYNIAFQVPLQWAIIKAANALSLDASQDTTLVYKCKRKALKRLNNILSDPTVSTDEAVASSVQTVIHHIEFRKIHLRGLDTIITAHGGLEAVVQTSEVTCSDHILLMYTFVPYDILQISELDSLKGRFFLALSRMQAHFHAFVRTTARMEDWASTIDLADLNLQDGCMGKWRYSQVRQRVFSPETSIGWLIRREYNTNLCNEADFQLKARPFGALFQLIAILLGFECAEQRELFLRRLEQAASKSSTVCDITGKPKIMAGTFIFMAGHVCRQVQLELGFSERDKVGIEVALDGIAALKIFALLPEPTRLKLYTYLQYWLLGVPTSNMSEGGLSDLLTDSGKAANTGALKLDDLTQEDMRAMGTVITQSWVQSMRRNSVPVVEEEYFPA